jgi:hypothetical protein
MKMKSQARKTKNGSHVNGAEVQWEERVGGIQAITFVIIPK